ncbi:hypothetical protein FEM48_Zijuj10G0128400 [Ziziphus jujuba var. spinosa]|uniref:FAS1 domain-containing protein n=1 Tax=Ziziphus jujuba var. spinosa TaxID=714518 RepID=A0A978UNH3_ZIZJJ|nr:hypothetical protein FEM48_Zijuj10G0128400 [Ziziphus jujuba var. spinosa]
MPPVATFRGKNSNDACQSLSVHHYDSIRLQNLDQQCQGQWVAYLRRWVAYNLLNRPLLQPLFSGFGSEKNRSKNVTDRLCVRSNSSSTMEVTVDHHHPFDEACAVMRSRGCSVMASLLEMQTMLTIFAPIDQAMVNRKTNVSEFSSIFRLHIIPCRLPWKDLIDFVDGTELQSNLEGFTIKITGSSKGLRINGFQVILPDMHHNDWLVVHGIREILEGPKHEEKVPESFYGFGKENEENTNTG